MSTASDNCATDTFAEGTPLDEREVVDYLNKEPDFFRRHPELLAEMELPHQSGRAISLIEKQVAILRERGIQSRHKLSELLDAARDNDALFTKTQSLVLDLLDAPDIDSILLKLKESLTQEFSVNYASVLLLSAEPSKEQLSAHIPAQQDCLPRAQEAIGNILRTEGSMCGPLRESENAFLFGDDAVSVGSAAVAHRPINMDPHLESEVQNSDTQPPGWVVLLAVGHRDPEHYDRNTGTLFLDYLCDIAKKLIQRQLKNVDTAGQCADQ